MDTEALLAIGQVLAWVFWTVLIITGILVVFWVAMTLQDRHLDKRDAQHRAALRQAKHEEDTAP